MIKDTEIDTEPGARDPAEDRKRLIFAAFLLAALAVTELTLGKQIQEHGARNGQGHWTRLSLEGLATRGEVPETDKQRILYISNSHARTGGRVAKHLQSLLDDVQPNSYEVIDLAAPGIFAPELLQRTLLGMSRKPDLIIMAVAYISFSDRMKLSLQSHTARSFFKPGVYDGLTAGFWMRNYDVGLYLDTFLQQHINLFRYRNSMRDIWEKPVVRALKSNIDSRPVRFLEVDQNQSWRFPDGFDRNLFDWRLYQTDRSGHLEDMRDAVSAAAARDIPVIGINLPIHWDKSVRAHDEADYDKYRQELAEALSDTIELIDYQGQFPVEFSTYDALHPTWYGARLHALDLVLRMHKHGVLDNTQDPVAIGKIYLKGDHSISDSYKDNLDGDYDILDTAWFQRYDIFEPDNANMLMRYLASMSVGSKKESEHLIQLSLRLRYWRESDFPVPLADDSMYSETFRQAALTEIERAQERLDFFQHKLVEFQSMRLAQLPLPDLEGANRIETNELATGFAEPLFQSHYQIEQDRQAVSIDLTNGRGLARGFVSKGNRADYLRVDVLGDNSYLLAQKITDPVFFPSWIVHEQPLIRFGI